MTALNFLGNLCSIISGVALLIRCAIRLVAYIVKTDKKKSEPSAATEGSRVSKH